MEKFIDSHVHLNSKDYDNDLTEVIERSKNAGVERVLVIGCDDEGIDRAIELVEKDQENYIFIGIGCHPVDAKDYSENLLNKIENLILNNEKIIAVGEIGLDYHWYPEEKDLQKKIFREQIKLAKKLDMPIIIHSREAYEDCYQILAEEDYWNGVLHSFADNWEMAQRFLDKGMYIGISGPVTFKNGDNQKEVVKNIDINRLLIETDGPYLAPAPNRGKRNEPAYLEYIIAEIAAQKNISTEEVKKATRENTYRLFKKLK